MEKKWQLNLASAYRISSLTIASYKHDFYNDTYAPCVHLQKTHTNYSDSLQRASVREENNTILLN